MTTPSSERFQRFFNDKEFRDGKLRRAKFIKKVSLPAFLVFGAIFGILFLNDLFHGGAQVGILSFCAFVGTIFSLIAFTIASVDLVVLTLVARQVEKS